MSPVYKVNNLSKDNHITDIYVFSGLDKENAKQMTDDIRKDPHNSAIDYFDQEEIDYIIEKNVNVEVVPLSIYADDSIDVIKRKILLATDVSFPFESMYLFAKIKKKLSHVTVYQTLTQNGRVELTRFRLLQFLVNISYNTEEVIRKNIPIKEVYNYDDIIGLGLEGKEWDVSVPIGQHFVAVEGTYPYSVNPFNVDNFDPLLANSVSNMVSTSNSQLLLNTGENIIENNLFLCLTSSVIEYISEKSLNEETTMRIYYPFLSTANLLSFENYQEQMTSLIKESKKMVDTSFVKQIDVVELLNDIYKERNDNYGATYEGVDSIECVLHPKYSFNMPLDIVFKVLHADENVPMLKLNPGKGQEKLYRLYANRTSVDGRKIPYLAKSEALKYAKIIAKKSRVSAVIQPPNTNNIFFCEFADNGDITIKVISDKILPLSVVEELLRKNVNPVISIVADFVAQSGYQFDLFESFIHENVEMLDVSYKLGFPIRKSLDISKKHGCLAPVFNIIEETSSSKTQPVKLQYKRVSDFSEMESQEAFMLNQMKRGTEEDELISAAMTNFDMTEQQVRERLAALLSNIQVVHNAFQNKRFRIKNNPGFPVVITRNISTNDYDVIVSEITDAQYLPYIRTFVDSMMRISQEPDSTEVAKNKILSACRSKSKDTIISVADIVAAPENPINTYSGIEIEAEEVEFRDEAEQEEYLDILLGIDDDDEDMDENNVYNGGSKVKKGGKKKTQDKNDDEENSDDEEDNSITNVRDVTGMSLGHPNPFFKRMQERDPALFITKKEGKFNAYSKICPWNQRRQPVVLTQEEKERIDRKHPGSYKHAVKYGTDPKNPLWYICPRYWSLSKNTSLTEEQVKSGKYGKVISNPNAKIVPEGEDIFEFGHYNSEGNYQDFYPGFIDPGSHPDGFCLPCCFKNWSSPKQINLRKQCEKQGSKIENERGKTQSVKEKSVYQDEDGDVIGRVETVDYIMGADKFPLDQGRWGFLVPVLQLFFQYDSKKCMVSPSKPILKLDTPCILRRGVETSKTQSFIAAIADAYAEENKNNVLSISAMKKQIASAVTLSNFRLFQNGNLVDLFFDSSSVVDISKYQDEDIYKELSSQTNGKILLKKIVNSYENFLDYLDDDDIVIDYTYLWDIVCIPNSKLFKNGINLIILEAPNDDITANVQMICPTNQYVKDAFDFNKSSLILFKTGSYYEPIYVMSDTGKHINLARFFSLKSHTLLAPIKSLLMTAKSATNEMCVPLASMPTVYNFRSNIPALEIHRILSLRDIVIKHQIINYSGQTIAFIVSAKGYTGYVPTQASSTIPNVSQILLDDFTDYSNYNRTMDFLDVIIKITKGKVPCRPKLRVEEDGITIGILTETNQMIMLSKPELINDQALPAIDENMSVSRDITSETSEEIDIERVEYVNRIRLETEFYNSFRNTIRILLSRYENRQLRIELESKIRSPMLTYIQKLDDVSGLLKRLANEYIKWDDKFDIKQFMEEANSIKPSSCVLFKKDKCSTMPLCNVSSMDTCLTIIPSNNVLTGANSEVRYYIKMADELVRYNRIKSFIFKPQTFLSFGKIGYDLRDDEVLILQSMLTPEYFDGLDELMFKDQTYNNTFQTAQPLESVPYSSVYESKKQDENMELVEGEKGKMEAVTLYGKWKSFFSSGTKEVKFSNNNPSQTFEPILVLFKKLKQSIGDLTVIELKEMLVSQYEELLPNKLQVKSIWSNEGKKQFAKMLYDGELSLDSIVMSESYFASTIDFMLLAKKVNLPIIFYSSTNLSVNNKPLLKTMASQKYSFIKVPSLVSEELPSYRIIVGKEGVQISLMGMNDSSRKEIEDLPVFDITEYLRPFKIKVKKRPTKKVVSSKGNDNDNDKSAYTLKSMKPEKIIAKRKPRLKIVA